MQFAFFIINQSPDGSSLKRVYDEGMEQIDFGEELGYDALNEGVRGGNRVSAMRATLGR